MRISISHAIKLSLACAWGVGLAAAIPALAEEAKETIQPVPESADVQTTRDCPHCEQGQVDGYTACPHCRGRGRVVGHRGYGYGGYHHGSYGYGGYARRPLPGHNWHAPSKVTLQRERVQYWKYYPNYWSGRGPGPATPYHPMVYTPTDTTQLGFYYQHAPSWYAQPWRTPGPAHPGYWHNRYTAHGHHGYYHGHPVGVTVEGEHNEEAAEGEGESAEPQESDDSQSYRAPEPTFVPRNPRISVTPNLPPEA